MNKFFFSVVFIAICTIFCFQESKAQTVVVQNNGNANTQTTSQDPNVKYINGIPSTQDIGGVDTQVIRDYHKSNTSYVRFTNYQPTTVTVTYEINYQRYVNSDRMQKIGSVVIPTGGVKDVEIDAYYTLIYEIYTITRKL